jgi:hypothetical protein
MKAPLSDCASDAAVTLCSYALGSEVVSPHTWRCMRPRGTRVAVKLLLGYQKIESTARYLGAEVDDALELAEKIEV